jgi:hypothetical protein
MFTIKFWKDAAERAIRKRRRRCWRYGQPMSLACWQWIGCRLAALPALAALTSILMSIIATGVGDRDTATFSK